MGHIIVDSGASKAKWLIHENNTKQVFIETIGFNPYYYSPKILHDEITNKIFPRVDPHSIQQIHFYGAGISTVNKITKVRKILDNHFTNALIEVEHDLLAAARSLLQDQEGICCILGTGSNSCIYNGKQIVHNIPSLGYFFADEGSGTHIGKLFIESYLKNQLPRDLIKLFVNDFGLTNEEILDHIYNKEKPNQFLASFSPYVSSHIEHEFMRHIVKKSFIDFFETYITQYPDFTNYNLAFIGSIAFEFQKILREVALSYNLKIIEIQKDPMAGLIKYHAL